MAARKRKQKTLYNAFVGFAIVPLLGVNLFAIWKLSQSTSLADLPLIGFLFNGLGQLMLVMIINVLAITIMIMLKEN